MSYGERPVTPAVRHRLSLFAQNQINHPTTAHMLALLAAVVQDIGISAACLFEGIGEDGETIESTFAVDGLREPANNPVLPINYTGFDDGRLTKGIAGYISQQVALGATLRTAWIILLDGASGFPGGSQSHSLTPVTGPGIDPPVADLPSCGSRGVQNMN
jgi:hypothetical protein